MNLAKELAKALEVENYDKAKHLLKFNDDLVAIIPIYLGAKCLDGRIRSHSQLELYFANNREDIHIDNNKLQRMTTLLESKGHVIKLDIFSVIWYAGLRGAIMKQNDNLDKLDKAIEQSIAFQDKHRMLIMIVRLTLLAGALGTFLYYFG